MKNNECVLSMRDITKKFNDVPVLKNVDLEIFAGEVHGLVGANGAGKSTLMKILNGVYTNYDGKIVYKDQDVSFKDPFAAQRLGVYMIHQELDLITNLTVADNIYMGHEVCANKSLKILDKKAMLSNVQKFLDELGFDIKAGEIVERLSTAQQQLLLVAKCVMMNADVIVMDEPTSSLSDTEVKRLFSVIGDLKRKGKAIIYISHYLEEIFEVCDRVTVLRDGSRIDTLGVSECDEERLVQLMIGKAFDSHHKYLRSKPYGETVLSVQDYADHSGKVNGISFDLHRGEIIGMAGVVGSGRTEFVELLYGAKKKREGKLKLLDKEVELSSPAKAVKNGFAFISEDRKIEGLITRRAISDNVSIINFDNCLNWRFINYRKANASVDDMIKFMSIRCHSRKQEATDLSGGNQQKVILGRWISVRPKILILDQPTRGIDIGAKAEIYQLINDLAEQGTSIILISDEMNEVINLSDTILALKKGKVVQTYNNKKRDVTEEELLHAMVV